MFKAGNIKKNCRNKIKCFRCKVEANHYPALCYPKSYSQHTNSTTNNSNQNNSSITPPAKEQTATCLVKSDTAIVLQTARPCVMNKHEDQFCVVNVLFDTGSQQTFTSDMEDQLGISAVKYKLGVGAAESRREPGSETVARKHTYPLKKALSIDQIKTTCLNEAMSMTRTIHAHNLFFRKHEKYFIFFSFLFKTIKITTSCVNIFLPSKLNKFCIFLLENTNFHQKLHIDL